VLEFFELISIQNERTNFSLDVPLGLSAQVIEMVLINITDQNNIDTGLIRQQSERIVISRYHGQFPAILFGLLNVVDGYFFGTHRGFSLLKNNLNSVK
jgi:hypothetical protein